MKRGLVLLLAGAVIVPGLSACATQTVQLLHGEGDHPVGKLVELDRRDGSDKAVLDAVNDTLASGSKVRHNVKVKPAYDELMAGLPLPSRSFAITFPPGADLPVKDDRYIKFLDDIRTEIALHPGAEVQVSGHTDSTGGPGYDNVGLSQRRADRFRDVLIESGFQAGQINAVGRGALEPADRDDPNNNDKNRRIEVIVR